MDFFIKPAFAATEKIKDNFALTYDNLGAFIDKIVPVIFTIAGLMVAFYFIIGAFELITSQGDKAHIVSARSKIYHSIIGLILLLMLFLVMQYLIPVLTGNTNFQLF